MKSFDFRLLPFFSTPIRNLDFVDLMADTNRGILLLIVWGFIRECDLQRGRSEDVVCVVASRGLFVPCVSHVVVEAPTVELFNSVTAL